MVTALYVFRRGAFVVSAEGKEHSLDRNKTYIANCGSRWTEAEVRFTEGTKRVRTTHLVIRDRPLPLSTRVRILD